MGCGASSAAHDTSNGSAAAGSPSVKQAQEHAHAEEEPHGEVDKDMWEGIISRIKPTMLKAGAVQSVIVIGAGASGLRCAALLKQKGIEVIILEGRDRIGGDCTLIQMGSTSGATGFMAAARMTRWRPTR